MNLTEEEYEVLIKGFMSERDSNRVDYAAFAREVNKIFTLKELTSEPTMKIPSYGVTSVLAQEDVLTPEEEVKVDTCLKRLGDIKKKKKLHFKPMFQAKVKTILNYNFHLLGPS
jgi:hypothetical protein